MDKTRSKEVTDDLIKLLFDINSKLLKFNELGKGDVFPPSHIKTLIYLHHKKSVTISDMAKCLIISKSNMTPIIDKLIEEGFVNRFTDKNDRRKINVELTEKGESFVQEKFSVLKNSLSDKISTLENSDLDRLSDLIKEFKHILTKLK